eukprot:1354020-Prymnesium_polylepis.1
MPRPACRAPLHTAPRCTLRPAAHCAPRAAPRVPRPVCRAPRAAHAAHRACPRLTPPRCVWGTPPGAAGRGRLAPPRRACSHRVRRAEARAPQLRAFLTWRVRRGGGGAARWQVLE